MQLLTPAATAGVAVLQVDASQRAAVLACLRRRQGDEDGWHPGGALPRALLQVDGVAIDDVLVVDRASGLELHVHGAPALLRLLAERFGVRVAAAESAAETLLRAALSGEQLALALEQQRFDWSRELQAMAAATQGLRATAFAAAAERSRIAMAHAEAPRLVLVGQQNAGKSTLFNRLLFRERALTGPQPGLTRDAIVERTTLAGYPYDLVDTAGEGDAATSLDARAIEAGRDLRAGAFVVLVVDGRRGPGPADQALLGAAALVVANKVDLASAPWPSAFPRHLVTAARIAPPEQLRAAIGLLLREHRRLPTAGPVGGPAALSSEQYAQLQRHAGAVGIQLVHGPAPDRGAPPICAAPPPSA